MATIYQSLTHLNEDAIPVISSLTSPVITDPTTLRHTLIDNLISTAEFADNSTLKHTACNLIYQLAQLSGATSASIYPLYHGFGQGIIQGYTVPALNIRTLTYDFARLIFRIMQQHEIGAVVFELSRTEIVYTNQRPKEYAVALLAAAIKEGYQGPIFILGDHYQFNRTRFMENKSQEIEELKTLIKESLDAKYGNIDIDASTLVDLSKTDLSEQQKDNSEMTAVLTSYIRELEQGTTISIGGEIGHIGDRNSTVADFEAFMSQYLPLINGKGISKVSVQTGTSHGGTPLPDGTLKEVSLDFSVLKTISTVAREKYKIGGAVQHGASTLPLSSFDHFVKNKTLEIHLATGLQNIIFDNLPMTIKDEMYTWLRKNLASEHQVDWTNEQFIYKTRKKALGPFKRVLWTMTEEEKSPILSELGKHLTTIFEKLQTFNTRESMLQFYR